ncbi:(2Fe-2S)-binding protein [Streptomyces sp. NPDC001770]
MYVCSCFGVTEQQVKQHAEAGACTPRQIASACKAGTDCGGCVRRIQALLGRGECPRREPLERRADLSATSVGPSAASVAPSADPLAAAVSTPAAAFPEAA